MFPELVQDCGSVLPAGFIFQQDGTLAQTAKLAQDWIATHSSEFIVLSQFQTITAPDAVKLLMKSPTKHCGLDPAPTWLIKRAANMLAPVIAAVCNASLEAGILPTYQKQAVVTARLKKPSLNLDDLNSYGTGQFLT